MGMKSSKAQQGAVSPIQIRFNGGLNYSKSPSQINDNEMVRCLNFIYNSQTGTPEVRPGTVCVTAAPLASPLLKIYYYEKSASQKWLVCASGGKLYYLNVDAWVEIGALNDSTTVPSFLTYNTYLLIADGGTNLKKWDGTTFSALSDSLSATAIEEIGGRVVINSKGEPDLITFSGVEDETMWNTADLTNPAIGIRAGFGDNMLVNGFAVFGTDLIVSKRGQSEKCFYRVSTAGAPTEWSVSFLTGNNCSQGAHTVVSAFNNVLFVDTNGFKSIKGVTEYGDLQIDISGGRINTAFNDNPTCESLGYIPAYTALWMCLLDRVYCYHDLSGSSAFTELEFMQGRVTSLACTDTEVYLSGYNGYLYKLDVDADNDEVTPAVYVDFNRVITSKRFSFFGGGILRKTSLELKAIDTPVVTTAYLRANTADAATVTLKALPILQATQYVYNATGDLNDATTVIGDMLENVAWIDTTTNRVRGESIQWQIDATKGKFGLEGLTAEIALVTG